MAILSALVPAARCANSGRFCARNVYFIFPVLRDWDERLWPNEMEYARRVEQREMGAIARSGDQFGIIGGASVSRTVVVFTCDCVLVWATRCRWQFPREPEGNCRERAIFWDGRLARSACNSGKSRGSLCAHVRFRTRGAEFLGHLRFGSAPACSLLHFRSNICSSAAVLDFFSAKPCGLYPVDK
jgi:hypothetical protein